jgi:PemK-like, MazF-like toxin of type II toxin-antitoxin system
MPSPRSGRKSSGGSWKTPEPADVISYSYLWAREAAQGEESGRKDRPVVVVVAAIAKGDRTQLLVAPVTHTRPQRTGDAIEIPLTVRKKLGLDREESWIVVTELNRFIWPGPDIRIASGQESPIYDAIPDWLFFEVRDAMVSHNRRSDLTITRRTE